MSLSILNLLHVPFIYKFHVKLVAGIAPSLFGLPDMDEMNLPPTNKDFFKSASELVCVHWFNWRIL